MMIGERPVKGALGHVVQINICPKRESKRLPTLAAWKPVPGYRHKMVLYSHLEYPIPRYVDVNIVTPSPPRSDAILKHELSTRGGRDSAYERGGDARRLAWGCKFRILVSLRVFWAKGHHI